MSRVFFENKNCLGFGLVELMLVLAITAVLSLASLVVAQRLNRLMLLQATQRMASDLASYQLLASQREDDLKLVFNEYGYQVFHKGTEDVLQTVTYPKYLQVTFNSAEEDILYIYASGVVSPTTFYVSRKGDVCQIVMSMRGRIRNLCEKELNLNVQEVP